MTARPRRSRSLPVLAGLAFAFGLASPAGVGASQGVRINVGRIEVHDTLSAGRTYHLPDLEVSNPGTEPARYEMLAGVVVGQDDTPLDPAWVSFVPSGFVLDPQQVQRVAVTITIPTETKAATYGGLLKAQLAPTGAGVAVGAAAAARITFTTAPPGSFVDAVVVGIGEFLAATQPWPLVILLGLALVLAARVVARRWDIRVQRR